MRNRVETNGTPARPARCQGRGRTFFWGALLVTGIVALCCAL